MFISAKLDIQGNSLSYFCNVPLHLKLIQDKILYLKRAFRAGGVSQAVRMPA
jgi:hypothetical protein